MPLAFLYEWRTWSRCRYRHGSSGRRYGGAVVNGRTNANMIRILGEQPVGGHVGAPCSPPRNETPEVRRVRATEEPSCRFLCTGQPARMHPRVLDRPLAGGRLRSWGADRNPRSFAAELKDAISGLGPSWSHAARPKAQSSRSNSSSATVFGHEMARLRPFRPLDSNASEADSTTCLGPTPKGPKGRQLRYDRGSVSTVWASESLMHWKDRIIADRDVLVGKPIVKGTRLSVDFILSLLAEGWTEEQVLESYPQLQREDLMAVFAFVQQCMVDEQYVALEKLG